MQCFHSFLICFRITTKLYMNLESCLADVGIVFLMLSSFIPAHNLHCFLFESFLNLKKHKVKLQISLYLFVFLRSAAQHSLGGQPADPGSLFLLRSPLSRPLYPCLPHLFLHFSHLDSILGCLFTASVFQSPVLPLFLYFPSPAAPSITHSLLLTSPSPCYLLSVCPCSVSPLAHLSLSPCAYCHHAQCPPTRLTPLFLALCLLSLSFFLFSYFHCGLMQPFSYLCLISLYNVVILYFEERSHISTD